LRNEQSIGVPNERKVQQRCDVYKKQTNTDAASGHGEQKAGKGKGSRNHVLLREGEAAALSSFSKAGGIRRTKASPASTLLHRAGRRRNGATYFARTAN